MSYPSSVEVETVLSCVVLGVVAIERKIPGGVAKVLSLVSMVINNINFPIWKFTWLDFLWLPCQSFPVY